MSNQPFSPADCGRPQFITAPMSTVLDLVRTLSALIVLVGHARQFELILWGPVTNLGSHYAVVVFFVVSGLSIGSTIRKPGTTLASFAADRTIRILPVAYAAIAFSSIAFLIRHGEGAVTYDDPSLTLTPGAILYPAFFLTESARGVLPVWNPAFWSLSYEVWYYAMFAAAFFLRGGARLAVLCSMGLLAGPQILVMMPIWLLGIALAWWPQFLRAGRRGGAGLILLAAVLAALVPLVDITLLEIAAALSPIPLVNAQNVMADTLLGLAVALALAGIRPLLGPSCHPLDRVAPMLRWSAGMSFTTYLFHMPLIFVLESWGIKNLGDPLAITAAFAAILLACAGAAQLVERRTHSWRKRLAAAWASPPAFATALARF